MRENYSGASTQSTNSFYEDLDYSHKQSIRPFWSEAYKRYFGDCRLTTDLVMPVENRPDNGVDKIIHFSNGTSATVDEKCHRGGKGFNDNHIFLEINHTNPDGSFHKPGWITDKNKECDYLAYAKEDMEQVYIYPFREMQHVYELHGSAWQLKYKVVPVDNNFYITECLLLPADVVSEAIQKNFVISVPHKFWN